MNRKEAAELLPIIKAFSEGKPIEQRCAESWVEIDEDSDFHFPANSYRIKPEEASDNNPSASTSEYHLEGFDNGYTIAEEEVKVCAVGDDDTKKHLGEFILADIIHHCNLTCSNKVKITVKIESED